MHYRVNRPAIVSDLIDGEVILLNLAAGTYYNLELTSATLWQWLESISDAQTLLRALCQAYPDQTPESLKADLEAWLQELLAHSLIESTQESVGAAGPDFPELYQPPRLQAHADLEELLQLDPIHEVAEPGWPSMLPH